MLQADGAAAQLEQFLQDDMHRFMELREHLDHQASTSDAAVLASTADERQRRVSSSSTSNSGISFVKLPDDSMFDVEDGDEGDAEHHPVAAALAAAMAAAGGLASAPFGATSAVLQQQEHVLPTAEQCAASEGSSAAVTAGVPAQQQAQGSTSSSGSSSKAAVVAAAEATQFVMQPDEEIAEQKRAARARLAELEGAAAPAAEAYKSVDEAAASSAKGVDSPDWVPEPSTAGSMHSSKVPERPRGLVAAMPPSKGAVVGYRPLLSRLANRLCEAITMSSEGVLPEHNHFLQQMMGGLMLCVVLLPVLWLLQADGGRGAGVVRSLLPAAFIAQAEHVCNMLYLCSAVGMLVYCLARVMVLPTPLLHFREPALERQYLLWSNAGRLLQDCLFQVTFLVVGSCLWLRLLQSDSGGDASAGDGLQPFLLVGAAPTGRLVLSALTLLGSSLPVVMLVLLRSPRYVEWREPLLAGSRLCSVLALSVMQLAAGPDGQLQLNMPFIALAQVMSIACMQVRLSSFVPSQVLHLLVLVVCSRAVNPLLQFTQLFGGWLCLPCLVLFSMELHSRKAFLSTLAPAPLAPAGQGVACR
jgi:hypothetical protein